MRAVAVAIVVLFVVLFSLTIFPYWPASRRAAEREDFSSSEIDQGLRLSVQRKLIFWSGTFLSLGFLVWLVFSGKARRVSDFLHRKTGGRWWLTLLLMGGFCFFARQFLVFPLKLVSLVNERAWYMTDRGLVAWLGDYGKSLALTAGIGAVLLLGLYLLMRRFRHWWWALAACSASGFSIVFVWIMPICIDPLFYEFRPLDTEKPKLAQRIRKMTDRAGIPVQQVLVMIASSRGVYTNAYFTGFGSTRRIVLYDTLLQKDYSTEEIESVVAHEIGHWRHRHIVLGISLAAIGGFIGFFVLSKILSWAINRPPFHLKSIADPAGVPLLLLLVMLGSWLAMPVQNVVSRHFERQADTAALDIAGETDAFIQTQRRLARTNKQNVAPTPWAVWLFSTHPPTVERIQMARRWKKQQQ